jgi:hypothetical protein
LLVLGRQPARAQGETKPVQVRTFEGEVEEFNVLATDKKVRQGPYVRYRPNTFSGLAVLESGSYDHGLKEGEWCTFASERPWNSLRSKGMYHAGVPDGRWVYYHYRHPSGSPFNRSDSPVAESVPRGPDPKAGYSVNITDTAAAVQALGLFARGVRVGVWLYFDGQGQLIQKVDHFSNQLIYWRPETGSVVSGAAALTHPAMYLGGKTRLSDEIWQLLNGALLIRSDGSNDNGVAEVAFAIDSAGHQTGVSLVATPKPTRYQKLILAAMAKVPDYWLPQASEGKAMAAEYKLRITSRVVMLGQRRGLSTTLDLLGD